MNGVRGSNKVSKFTLLVLEDLGYFIADYSKADYYNYLRSDLVPFTVDARENPMSIPITTTAPTNAAAITAINAECLNAGNTIPFN